LKTEENLSDGCDFVQEMMRVPENLEVLLPPQAIVICVQYLFRLPGMPPIQKDNPLKKNLPGYA